MIIGITGTLGAGKGTVVEILKGRGFRHFSVRDFLVEEIRRRGLVKSRESMVLVANDLRAKGGASYIVERLYDKAREVGGDAVIESIRCVGEVEALRGKEGFVLWAVDADVESRFSRIVERGSFTDRVSFQDFVRQEAVEMESLDKGKQNLSGCIAKSDHVFRNDWTKAELGGKVLKVLESTRSFSVDKEKAVYVSGILSDHQIKDRVSSGRLKIVPFNESCVQPASYDLHLDNKFKIFKSHSIEFIDTKKPVDGLMEDVVLSRDEAFVLQPGGFALGLIKEVTGVDAKHVGRLEGKSSLARLGLIIHTTAGFLDPGNSLQLTLELFNASPVPIKLYPGMKIAQIAFEELSEACEVPYGAGRKSSYYGVSVVQASDMSKNFAVFDETTGMYNPEVQ